LAKRTTKRGKGKGSSGRVRNVIRCAPHRVVGQVAWVKSILASVYWESRPERNSIRIAHVDPRVLTVQDQPFTVRYRFIGKLHDYTPDLRFNCRSSRSIVEVKPFKDASSTENQDRFCEIARVLAREEFDFNVWTETEYAKQPRLNNATYVLRYRNYPFEFSTADAIQDLLDAEKDLAFTAIQKHLGPCVNKETLFALVCRGLVHIDCDLPFSPDPVFHRIPSDA